MAAQGTTTVNFGAGALEATASVTGQTGITTANLAEAWLQYTTDDSVWVEQMQIWAGPITNGVGFPIVVKPMTGKAYGTYTVNWVWA